jgi:C-terminal processing protease CtpA/Prc
MIDETCSVRKNTRERKHIDSSNICFFVLDSIEDNGNSHNENYQSADTIYVKEVRQNSPAYKAGLRQGDRILSVNDQSIQGKTYSQVIAIIQNT